MADENENIIEPGTEEPGTEEPGTEEPGTEEISSKPDYTPIRINQLTQVGKYEDDDMLLLARPRPRSAAYTTVR